MNVIKCYLVIDLNDFIEKALQSANKALSLNEVPVGAVIVSNNKIIATAHNLTRTNCDVTAHAEILAIRKAERLLGDWRLSQCDLYVTLEPCMMCMGAIINSRISRIYFGAYDKNFGFALSNHFTMPHNTEIYGGICEDECQKLLTDFFKRHR